ncbi:hypothetical protein Leryth_025524 [Lithospermum erythrorhizon]|nr:hypothetical protein Leryth_025524 [Lithospermum erythrorhizon]
MSCVRFGTLGMEGWPNSHYVLSAILKAQQSSKSWPVWKYFEKARRLMVHLRRRSRPIWMILSMSHCNHAVSFYWKETDALSVWFLQQLPREERVSILLVDFYKAFGSSKEVHPIDEDVVTNGYTAVNLAVISTVAPVLDIEIREALFGIKNEKPGRMGFSSPSSSTGRDFVGEMFVGIPGVLCRGL